MAAATSVNRIESAHQMYREGRHKEALSFYTEALAMAKTKPQKIALHSNRAACYLKLHNFKKAAEECTSVLELDRNHTGALMLRAQTLVTLKEYQSALFDVGRLMELNPSSEVYRDLQERLKTQLSLAPIPECEAEMDEEEDDEIEPKETEKEGKRVAEGKYLVSEVVERAQEVEHHESITPMVEVIALTNNASPSQTTCFNKSSDQVSKGWKTIPKPKGHSNLDYSRWDAIEDDSSEDEDDDDEGSEPQYQFRVKTVDVRSVK